VIVVHKVARSLMAVMPGWLLVIFGHLRRVPGDPFSPAGCIGSHGCLVLHATRKGPSRGERALMPGLMRELGYLEVTGRWPAI
jgi:hypothetical protein